MLSRTTLCRWVGTHVINTSLKALITVGQSAEDVMWKATVCGKEMKVWRR
jgi:hypothetical protein